MIMDSLIIILFVSLLTSQQALGQNVETRGTNDKVSGSNGGQARAVYYRSPTHVMMHYGKRASSQPTSQVLNPYNADQLASHFRPDQRPYLFTIELERGQTLQAMPEEFSSSLEESPMYNVDRQPEYMLYNLNPRQRQQQAFGGEKFSKLTSGLLASLVSDNDEERTKQSSSSDTQDDNQQSPQPVQQTFSVSTRSNMQSRANTLAKPKVYVSNLLYGGRPVSPMLPSLDTFNKKADRGENLFMHFGRK